MPVQMVNYGALMVPTFPIDVLQNTGYLYLMRCR